MMITEIAESARVLPWDHAVEECVIAAAEERWISDDAARTIATAYMAPVATSWNMTSLAHGRAFNTEYLREEIDREMRLAERLNMPLDEEDKIVLPALRDWLNGVEQR